LSFFVGLTRADTDQLAQIYATIGSELPPDAVVMIGDAPGFYYHTGLMAVSIPNEPIESILLAATQYQVGYLVLDPDHPTPLTGLYTGDSSHPNMVLTSTYSLADIEGNTHEVQLYQLLPP
jgi:hypothetical protein